MKHWTAYFEAVRRERFLWDALAALSIVLVVVSVWAVAIACGWH